MSRFTVLLLLSVVFCAKGYACKCPSRGIEYDVDKAFDIIVGRVTAEKRDTVTCGEFFLDYSFTVQIEFSYRGKQIGVQKIFAGKGGGSCGAILRNNTRYLLVIYKSGNDLYTTMCYDNNYLAYTDYQVKFLNGYFHKDYQIQEWHILNYIMLLCLVITSGAGIVVSNCYERPGKYSRLRAPMSFLCLFP